MSIELIGGNALLKNIQLVIDATDKATIDALIAGAKLVEGEAKQLIAKKSNGDTVTRYRNGGRSYEHVASLPFDPPNTDTGALIKSIQVEVTPSAIYVGTNNEYAPHLEFGTVKMKARPFLNPAYENRKEEVLTLVSAFTGVAIDKLRDHF